MVKVKEDMTGWKMWEHGFSDSRLTVIKQTEDYISLNGAHYSQWLCECNCSNKTIIVARGNDIRRGHVRSCGCLQKELATKRLPINTKKNNYDLSGEYGIGYCSNTNNKFYFDMDDYDKIKDYCWYECVYRGYSSLKTNIITINGRRLIRMHILLGYKYHDHIDRNPLNNRKSNLRPSTATENARNHSKSKNNTSGFIGVSWSNKENRWRSYIKIDRKSKMLGSFTNKEDAIIARLQAEAKYFGEFAPQRHLFEEYGITVQN